MDKLSAFAMSLALGFVCAMMDRVYLPGFGGALLCFVTATTAALAGWGISGRLAQRIGARTEPRLRLPDEVLPYSMIAAACAFLPFLFMGASSHDAIHLLLHALLVLSFCVFFSVLVSAPIQPGAPQAHDDEGGASVPLLQGASVCALATGFGWILGMRAYTFARLDSIALHATTAAFVTVLVTCALLLVSKHMREVRVTAQMQLASELSLEDSALAVTCASLAKRAHLSRREEEVLTLLAQGHDAQSIERTLLVSRNTVKTHMRNVYAKLGIHSREELLARVEDERLRV